MSAEDGKQLEKLEKRVNELSIVLEKVVDEIKVLASIPGIEKSLVSLEDELQEVHKEVSPVAKVDDLVSGVKGIEKQLSDMASSKELENIGKQVQNLDKSIQALDDKIEKSDKKNQLDDLDSKIDEIGSALTNMGKAIEQVMSTEEAEVIGKKIDDLQQYVASLSSLEEKVEDLNRSFKETGEIVGIIVRQLDDIERKYNKSLEFIDEALNKMSEMGADTDKAVRSEKAKQKEAPKAKPEIKEPIVSPSTIDEGMDRLSKLVSPKTEAARMAEALEEVRDQLTDLISEHTPVLFQFGKVARELKSYPPTATLNENDIARLNKEIRSWRVKLKEVDKE